MLWIDNIVKSYSAPDGRLVILNGASARIEAGTFAAICGPSGCGKSTLLLILGALLRPDSGAVRLAGEDLFALSAERRARRRAETIGFIFQRFHLIPYLTVEENVRAAAVALPDPGDSGRAAELLARFQVERRRRHLPGQLSVGEQQRVSLARALYNRPKVLLADEPTGNLDPDNAEIVLRAFEEFAAAGGVVVMVTHHPAAAERAARRWRLRDGMVMEDCGT